MNTIYKRIAVLYLIVTILTPQFSFGALTQTLKTGDSGSQVSFLQSALGTLKKIVPTTGYFGQVTANALKSIQCQFGIACTNNDPGFGIVGPKTRSLINSLVSGVSSTLGRISPRTLLGNLSGSGSGLVGWWKLDDGSGATSAADSSGGSATMTLANTPTSVAGQIGTAYTFNGTSQYAEASQVLSSSEFTFSGWVKETVGGPIVAVGGDPNNPGSYNNISLIAQGADLTLLNVHSGNATSITMPGSIPTGQWALVTVVYTNPTNDGASKMYVNGQLVKSSYAGGFPAEYSVTSIGENYYGGVRRAFFNGTIDDVRIYNRALSDTEVSQLYQQGVGLIPPSLSVQAATSIGSGSVTLNGTLTGTGGSNPTAEGFNYGTNTSYGQSSSATGTFSGGAFSQTVSGLTPNTTYHFQSFATNAAGTGVSTDQTFTTLLTYPPVISSISSGAPTVSRATITWTTDINSDSQVIYGTTPSYNATSSLDSSIVTSHSIAVTGLSPNTTYHYAVLSKEPIGGLVAKSSDRTFTTGTLIGANIIPSDRRIDWSENAGKSFTIPSWPNGRNAKTDDGAVGDGVHDDTQAIENCMLNTPMYTFCYVPAGTYKLSGGLYYSQIAGFKGIRGAGADVTTFTVGSDFNGTVFLVDGGSYSPSDGVSSGKINSGYTKGSSRLYMPSSDSVFGQIGVGTQIMISQTNGDGDENTSGYMGDTIGQIDVITAKGSNYIDLERPLNFDLHSAFNPKVERFFQGYSNGTHQNIEQIGFEDFGITRAPSSGFNGGSNIYISTCHNCFVKNIHSRDAWNYHVALKWNYGTVIRDNFFEQTWQFNCGGNACYGAWIFDKTSDTLVENNIMKLLRHSMITEYGGTGNVFGYNYSIDPINEGGLTTDYMMGDIITHGGEARMNLWEGNTAAIIRNDNVLGSSRWNTYFRNNIERKGLPSTYIALNGIDVQVGNLYENYIGNVFQLPAYPVQFPSPLIRAGTWQDQGAGNYDYLGRPLLDPRPLATMIFHGNYDFSSSSVTWDPSIPEHNLPSSLYLTAKPDWWGTSAWPGNGPDVPGIHNMNPAELRYTNSPAPTQTAPIISGIASSPADTNAIITWTTDQPTSSTLNYGVNSLYGSTLSSASFLTSHTITITGLAPNTTYHYQVQGTNTSGSISSSSDFTFTTTGSSGGGGGDVTAPSVPMGLTSTAISSSEIDLTWNASTDNVAVVGYKIYRNNSLITTSLLPAYADTGLSASTTYSYTVAAYDLIGNTSLQSNASAATTHSQPGSGGDTIAPSIPSNLIATPISTSEIDLSWNTSTDNVAVIGYKIYRNNSLLTTSLLPTYADTGLLASTAYSYTIAAYDLAGNISAQSSAVSAITQAQSTGGGGSSGGGGTVTVSGGGGGGYSYPTPSPTQSPTLNPATFPVGCTSVTTFSTVTGQRCVAQSTTVNFAPPGCINGAVFNTITGQRCATQTTTKITAYSYNRDLTIKSQGNDVKALQQFLMAAGYLAAGNDSGYFGALTQSALVKYQAALGISPASGYFGSLTRKIVMGGKVTTSLAVSSVPQQTTKPVVTTTPSPTPISRPATVTLTPAPTPSTVSSSGISKTLALGAKGNDVLTLQRFLISKNFMIRGKDSGTFDQSTFIALGLFQLSNGIVASVSAHDYGVLNEATRIKINTQLK